MTGKTNMIEISKARGAAALLVLAMVGGLAACSWLGSDESSGGPQEAGSGAVAPEPTRGNDSFIWTAEDLKARSDTLDLPEQPEVHLPVRSVPRSESDYNQGSPYSRPETTYRR